MENEDKILDKITDSYYTDYTMITEYIIPVGKTIIGNSVFSHCIDLERLYIPWYVKNIPVSNFFYKNLISILDIIIRLLYKFAGKKARQQNSAQKMPAFAFLKRINGFKAIC